MRTVGDILLNSKNTPLGELLNVKDNSGWLSLLLYASPHINLDMPTMDSVQIAPPVTDTDSPQALIRKFINAIDSNQDAINQMSEANLDDVYFLSQRAADKLAVAVYTLYLYGSR